MLVQKGLHLPKAEDLADCPLIPLARQRRPPMAVDEDEARALWLVERRKGIGASDVPIIAGTSKFKSRYALWMEKAGRIEPDEDETIRQMCGNELESGTARIFTKVHSKAGRLVDPCRIGIAHPLFQYNVASIDRFLFLDGNFPGLNLIEKNPCWIPLEIKMVDSFGKKDWSNFEIPEMYYDQVQNQLDCSGRPAAVLMALFGGNDPQVWTVWRDMERCQQLGNLIQDFKRSLDNGEQPEPDDEESTKKAQGKLYPEHTPRQMLPLTPMAAKECEVYEACSERLDKIDDAKRKVLDRQILAANRIREEIKTAEGGRGGGYKATWKTQDGSKVNSEKLAKDPRYAAAKTALQRIEAEYREPTRVRVLRIVKDKP